ncbi:3-deoxy-7-phosphoheptulonate synthase [Candidatus Peregrinibacteria bacterium CG11_big_fil_rev_8_21_14_0_20_46_8]|nr:MAG: 3-deoxy-7-phosphoheptulonate synthase [Candidatus Peregrinibacteria bacterium CG11_big_fil_rev_8_21_14_0_20_46_8]
MLIVMHSAARSEQIDAVVAALKNSGLNAELLPGSERTAIGVMGNKAFVDEDRLLTMSGVKEIIHVTKPYKLVSREFFPEDTIVHVKGVQFGGTAKPVHIAGPCAVESREQLFSIAKGVKESGADMLRGGAFKPRSSPYSFQGLGEEGIALLREVADELQMPFVSEILSIEDLELFEHNADMIQIGARNMHNFDLLQRVADLGKPILLKRGMSATVEEFLLAAEYILNRGNKQVVLCERGIRTFEQSTRNILDLNSLALIRLESHLPIIADPSHSAGRYDLVAPLAKAAIAAGAHGLIVEVHNKPSKALSDGKQSLDLERYEELMKEYRNTGKQEVGSEARAKKTGMKPETSQAVFSSS